MTARHPVVRAEIIVLVALGGFAGASTRYLVGILAPGLLGTFIANVTGSFVLGLVIYEVATTGHLSEMGRFVISTGFLSSYTTYSTFAYETFTASPMLGITNVVVSYAVGFAAVISARGIVLRLEG